MRRGCEDGGRLDPVEDGATTSDVRAVFSLRGLCCQTRRSQTRKGSVRYVSVVASDVRQEVPDSIGSPTVLDGAIPGTSGSPAPTATPQCRRRRGEGAPVPRSPNAPGVSKLHRARALLGISMLLLLLCLRSDFPHPQSWAARVFLLPLKAISNAEYTLVVLAPAICWITLFIWSRLELPEQNGAAGQRIAHILRTSLWVSLILVALTASFGGDFSVRLVAALIYFPAAALWLVYRSEWCKGSRRLISTWAVFLPLIFEYKLMYWWLRFAGLEQASDAYRPLHDKYAPRVLRLLVEQGGVFVKIGQMLSLLPAGVLPEAFTNQFKSLQSRVPPRPGAEVKRLVSEALGQPMESVFSRFDEVPIGSASIGQVHRARLADTGSEVVVKVQYPEVSQTIESDFTNCERIVRILDKTKMEQVRETKKHYINELDFNKEAQNLLRVRAGLCKQFPEVCVPEPVLEFCRPTVLVMTYLTGSSLLDGIMDMAQAIAKMRGKSVEDLIAECSQSTSRDKKDAAEAYLSKQDSGRLDIPKEKRRWRVSLVNRMPSMLPSISDSTKLKLLQLCMSTSRSARNFGVALYNSSAGLLGANKLSYSRDVCHFDPQDMSQKLWLVHGHQVLVDGLFSTDPHPGNILVGPGGRVGLIDFGQVCELKLQARVRFGRLLLALAKDSDTAIATSYRELGMRTRREKERYATNEELLALNARIRFGHASVLSRETYERYRGLCADDSVFCSEPDDSLGRIERLIAILRGTSFLLGIPTAHGPTTLWVDMAKELVEASQACAADSHRDDFGLVQDIERCAGRDDVV